MNSKEIETCHRELNPSENNSNEDFESLTSFNDKTPQIDSLINMSFQSEQNINDQIVSLSKSLVQGQDIYIQIDETIAENLESCKEYTLVPVANPNNDVPMMNVHNTQPLQPLNQQDCMSYTEDNGAQWSENISSFFNPDNEKPSTSNLDGVRDVNEESKCEVLKHESMHIHAIEEMDKENFYPNMHKYPVDLNKGVKPFDPQFHFGYKMPPPHRVLPHRARRSAFNHHLSQCHSAPVSNVSTPLSSSQNESLNAFGETTLVSSSSSDSRSPNKINFPQNLGLNLTKNHLANVTGPLDNEPYYIPCGQNREDHNQKERWRRHRIKVSCQSLRSLVPGLRDKSDKASVFEYTVQYLIHLRQKVGTNYDSEFLQRYATN